MVRKRRGGLLTKDGRAGLSASHRIPSLGEKGGSSVGVELSA